MIRLRSRAWETPLRIAVGSGISILALVFVVRDVDWGAIQSALSNVSVVYLFMGLISVTVNVLCKVARWQVLLGQRGRNISFWKLLVALLTGQMLNIMTPVRLGDLSRAYDIGGMGPGRVFVFGGIVIEKVIDTLCLMLLTVVIAFLVPMPLRLSQSAFVITLLAILVVIAITVIIYRLNWIINQIERFTVKLPEPVITRVMGHLRVGLESINHLGREVSRFKLVMWTIAIWVTAVTVNYAVLLAFDLRLPVTAACLLLVLLLVGVNLPSLPAGIGIIEYLGVTALRIFDVNSAVALSYSVVLHVITTIPMLLAGPSYLVHIARSRSRPME